jgi:hypothetical protein
VGGVRSRAPICVDVFSFDLGTLIELETLMVSAADPFSWRAP